MHLLDVEKFKNMQRFIRQTILPNFGNEAQQKLLNSKVLVIGAGGLGCPCLQYLVSSGIGEIGIVDGDNIDISNLQRQILFTTNDIGKNKAASAKVKLNDIHPSTRINSFPIFIDEKNASEIISKYDVVVDCTDDFKTRYLINDVCVELSNEPSNMYLFILIDDLQLLQIKSCAGLISTYC